MCYPYTNGPFAPMRDYDTPTFRSTGGRSSSELHKQIYIQLVVVLDFHLTLLPIKWGGLRITIPHLQFHKLMFFL